MDVLGDLAVRRQGAGQDERDVVPAHHVADPVADPGLEPGIGDRGEAPQRPEVVGRLLGVADPELDVVDALERQEVLGLVVGVLVDDGAGLVGGAAGDRVGHAAGLPAVRRRRRRAARPGPTATERRPGTGPGWSGRPCYAGRARLGRMDDLARRLRDAGTALLGPSGCARRGRAVAAQRCLRHGARRPTGARARSSPTSTRCSPTGPSELERRPRRRPARAPCRSGGSRPTPVADWTGSTPIGSKPSAALLDDDRRGPRARVGVRRPA